MIGPLGLPGVLMGGEMPPTPMAEALTLPQTAGIGPPPRLSPRESGASD